MRAGLLFTTCTACATLAAGCGGSGDGNRAMPGAGCDPSVEFCDAVPVSANACSDGHYWPLSVDSGVRPLTVHYSRLGDAAKARKVLAILEASWTRQVDELGFTAPLSDGGACGDDGRYDVFLWQGVDGAFVEAVADNPATPYDDWSTYMGIDAFGAYGGALLDTTLAHEFNHALQAGDDWWESALIFEMSATFVEALVYPDQDDYYYTLEDFQNRPEWSLFYDDNYRTWFMYGAAMFLHYLHERYYPTDPGFIARVWRNARSDPADGRPDFLDAFRTVLLSERGVDLDEAVVEFMQWRWFIAEFDDGAHFEHGADWPVPVAYLEGDAGDSAIDIEFEAMIYGAGYLRLVNGTAAERLFAVDMQPADMDVEWRLTTADGQDAAAVITVPAQSSRVLVATVLPVMPLPVTDIDFELRSASLSLTSL